MKTQYENSEYYYEIFDDGYDIFKNEQKILTQREPYAHVFVFEGTYEENALAHIKDIIETSDKPQLDMAKAKSDLDYLALMMDVELPSEEEPVTEEVIEEGE